MEKSFTPGVQDAQAMAALVDPAEGSDSKAVMVRPPLAVGEPSQQFVGNMQLPYLTIVQGVGELSDSFAKGDFVLSKEYRLAGKGEPLRIIILNFRQYWKEYVDSVSWSKGVRPRQFQTAAEAVAAGLTVERDPITGALPTAPVAMIWSLLIEKPKDLMCDLFCIRANDKEYAPALFPVERSAFLSVSTPFGLAANHTTKARGLYSVVWEMKTVVYTAKTGNTTWVPKIQIVEHLNDEQIENLKAAVN